MNTLLFLEQAADTTQATPIWLAILIAVLAAIAAGAKKFVEVKNTTVPKDTSSFDMLLYLFGKYDALAMIDDDAIAALNNLSDKGELTFEDYVAKLKSVAVEKAYTYITENTDIAKHLEAPAGLLSSVNTIVDNMIDAKYDEEAFKLLYEAFKAVTPELKSGNDTAPEAENTTKVE